jgi:NAD(P) transhydrogenase subunit alpha
MIIGVLKEPQPETRVSLLPEHLLILKKLNVDILIEINSGEKAFASDEKYVEAGGTIGSREEVLSKADIILSIHLPAESEIKALQSKIILGFYQPLYHVEFIKMLTEKKVTIFSIDMIPRTTRAQSMDVLSSQANIAGYKAVHLVLFL